jgi:aspartyl-tRNA(Asn)/glutamyl-tRNA(Gln) amidotransferase subunit C
MTVPREEVERIARLAALAVDEASLPELTAQIGDILKYIAQLEALEAEDPSPQREVGPASGPLRPDELAPIPMSRAPLEMAPERAGDFYVVPRVEGVGDE